MKKEEFIKELEYLLQDISEEEKNDAIAYYRDYLEEAGEENEDEVIRDFGSPERIASIIRSDLNGNLADGGEFTEKGYEDERFKEPNLSLVKRLDLPEKPEKPENSNSAAKSRQTRNTFSHPGNDKTRRRTEEKREKNAAEYGNWIKKEEADKQETRQKPGKPRWEWWQILGIIFLVFCVVPAVVPVVFGLGGGVIGILTVLVVFFIAITIALAALTFAFFLSGILLVIFSMTQMASPVHGLLALGTGIGFLGIGCLLLALCGIYYGKFLPWLIKAVIDGISRLIHRKEVSV